MMSLAHPFVRDIFHFFSHNDPRVSDSDEDRVFSDDQTIAQAPFEAPDRLIFEVGED